MSAVAVVTGTTHGIGRVTARELARGGYTVVMLCRNLDAALAVREQIMHELPRADLRALQCDLASLQSVRRCALAVRSEFPRIDLLIANAGLASTWRRMSQDGFELTFAVNHLAHFLLVRLLLDRMAPRGRIIIVASRAHLRGRLDLDEIANRGAPYNGIQAYARSKLANVLFTFGLARRLAGSNITANCLHPGVVATNLLPAWLRVLKPLISRGMLDAEQGARTSLYLALSPEVRDISGCYFDEHQRMQSASALAHTVQLQEALWTASEIWTEQQ